MNITFLEDVELEVVEGVDEETEVVDSNQEIFSKGETVNVDIFNEHGDFIDIQFADGSVVYNLSTSLVVLSDEVAD